jgi:hypothetical protein
MIRSTSFAVTLILGLITLETAQVRAAGFRAGAAAVDVSPTKFPVIVNGGFLQAIGQKSLDRLYARALVLDDGTTKLAVVVVDSCMMPRDLLDKAKKAASEKTGIPVDRMLVSATHTHTAPSAMWALGTPPDDDYVAFLPGKIAESIVAAHAKLQPARIGWAAIDDFDHTHNRRWIRRPDKMVRDPFGELTGRAHMHPGYQNPEAIGPSGPIDPGLSVVSVQTAEGKPMALLANYSMHYFGTGPVSADYYGKFVTAIAGKIGVGEDPNFVGIMSQGTSGDQHWMDYSKPKTDMTIDRYAEEVAARAFEAYRKIDHKDDVTLAMAEAELKLDRRTPDKVRLEWVKELKAKMASPVPANVPEVYACEAIAMDADPVRNLKLQALRIGEMGITAIPNEVYGITGLKLKGMSPLPFTINVELANGAEGYIPPPEQHKLGGYTTWPARTAALEVMAEPKIVETLLTLLEKVAGKPRKAMPGYESPLDDVVRELAPLAYWRMDEIAGEKAVDVSGRGRNGLYSGGAALFLPGPQWESVGDGKTMNRSVHFAGGMMRADIGKPLGDQYSVSLWFRNGLANDVRDTTGKLVDLEGLLTLGLTGSGATPGRLFLQSHDMAKPLTGVVAIAPNFWNHVVLVRSGDRLRLYLNGKPEIEGPSLTSMPPSTPGMVIVGKDSLGDFSFEGKIDDVAVFGKALTPEEAARLYRPTIAFDGEQ